VQLRLQDVAGVRPDQHGDRLRPECGDGQTVIGQDFATGMYRGQHRPAATGFLTGDIDCNPNDNHVPAQQWC